MPLNPANITKHLREHEQTFFRLWSRGSNDHSDYNPSTHVELALPHVRDFRNAGEVDPWLDANSALFPSGTKFVLRELPMSALPHFVDEDEVK